jgi:hypothetical protein
MHVSDFETIMEESKDGSGKRSEDERSFQITRTGGHGEHNGKVDSRKQSQSSH